MNRSSADQRNRIGIQWKMYAILIVFIGIVVSVIWIFQVQMMNYFYQVTKFNELEISGTKLVAELEHQNELEEVAIETATEYYTDIWVYHMVDPGKARLILDVKGTGENEIPFMTRKFSFLYDRAKQNGGYYTAMVSTGSLYEETELRILRDNLDSPESYPIVHNSSVNISALDFRIREIGSQEYVIVQKTNLTPIRAMVKTLQNQAVWTGLILALMALLMAWIMSRLITKPFVKMNAAAKQLAEGRYDVNFSGTGYREINELADTLNYASCELAKTDRLQKELISNISHDLRTPLTMIKGYGEVMRDIPGENTAENIQIIIDETSRLSELVNDMLDLSRIQAGTRKPEMTPFSLTDTVRDTMHRYERLTMQDGYRISFVAEENVQVCADRGMILQVVYNLINNAINYTGGDKRVTVKQEIRGRRVRISVTDTGEGITEEDLSMIWERYYKVDKVHRRATVGTGLGLSIVKSILEMHRASYGVQSTVGKGSIFWFELERYFPSDHPTTDYIEANYERQDTKTT